MKRKTFFLILAIIISAQCLCGCISVPQGGNSNYKYDPETAYAEMTGEVSVWWAPMDFMRQPLERAIVKFNKKYPKIKINPIYKTRADYYDDLNITYLNNSTPDVVRLDHVYVQSLGEAKRVVDLTKMTSNKVDSMEKDKFIDQTYQGMRIGDKQFGLPFESNTTLFMYNERICHEVFGNNYLPPKNYDELVTQSLAVNNYTVDGKKPYLGFIMPINASNSQHDVYVINGWLARFGATLLNEDRTKCTLDTKEAIEAFTKMKEMIDSGAVTHKGYAPYLENKFIFDGSVAFIEMGSWIYNDVKNMDMDENGRSDIRVAEIPYIKEGIPGYATLGSSGLSITSACKDRNKPAAYEFIKFLSTDYETHMDFAKEMKVFPSLKQGLDDPYYSTGDKEWIDYWDIFKKQLMISVPRPGTKYWSEVATGLKKAEMQLILGGAYTPEKVARDITAEINGMLTRS